MESIDELVQSRKRTPLNYEFQYLPKMDFVHRFHINSSRYTQHSHNKRKRCLNDELHLTRAIAFPFIVDLSLLHH